MGGDPGDQAGQQQHHDHHDDRALDPLSVPIARGPAHRLTLRRLPGEDPAPSLLRDHGGSLGDLERAARLPAAERIAWSCAHRFPAGTTPSVGFADGLLVGREAIVVPGRNHGLPHVAQIGLVAGCRERGDGLFSGGQLLGWRLRHRRRQVGRAIAGLHHAAAVAVRLGRVGGMLAVVFEGVVLSEMVVRSATSVTEVNVGRRLTDVDAKDLATRIQRCLGSRDNPPARP